MVGVGWERGVFFFGIVLLFGTHFGGVPSLLRRKSCISPMRSVYSLTKEPIGISAVIFAPGYHRDFCAPDGGLRYDIRPVAVHRVPGHHGAPKRHLPSRGADDQRVVGSSDSSLTRLRALVTYSAGLLLGPASCSREIFSKPTWLRRRSWRILFLSNNL